jgi:hypothetical protein
MQISPVKIISGHVAISKMKLKWLKFENLDKPPSLLTKNRFAGGKENDTIQADNL